MDKSWTVDDYFDLVVWYEPTEEMFGFQLCYDRFGFYRAVTWTNTDGFSHASVHDNDSSMTCGQSPVLRQCENFPWRKVLREFTNRSARLDPAIRKLITNLITEYGPKYPEPVA